MSQKGRTSKEKEFAAGLARRLQVAGVPKEILDEIVRDLKSDEAADINAGGFREQVEYMTETMGRRKAEAIIEDVISQHGDPLSPLNMDRLAAKLSARLGFPVGLVELGDILEKEGSEYRSIEEVDIAMSAGAIDSEISRRLRRLGILRAVREIAGEENPSA